MTRDEFCRKFRGELLLLLTEAWACRMADRGDLAALVEEHHVRVKAALGAMYDALQPQPARNGTPEPARQK